MVHYKVYKNIQNIFGYPVLRPQTWARFSNIIEQIYTKKETKEIKKVTAKQNIYMRGILIAVKQITYTSNDIKVKDKTTNN